MVVRIRLSRFGRRKLPFYRIRVADARSPRDGKFLENVGTYNPLPTDGGAKHVTLKVDRVKHWLACGAQPTATVAKLLAEANILPAPAVPDKGPQHGVSRADAKKE